MKNIYIIMLIVILCNVVYANTDDLDKTSKEYIFPTIKSSDILIEDNSMIFNISNKIDIIDSNITIHTIDNTIHKQAIYDNDTFIIKNIDKGVYIIEMFITDVYKNYKEFLFVRRVE